MNRIAEEVRKAMEQAFRLGQDYWRQADSESYKQNALSDGTLQRFREAKERIAGLIEDECT